MPCELAGAAYACAAMKTDKHLYLLFHRHPEWLFDMLGEPAPAASTFESITVKALERRIDGVVLTHAGGRLVVEFQFWEDAEIYWRTVEEHVAVQRQHPKDSVRAVVFFKTKALDPQTAPWTSTTRAVYLDKVLRRLARTNANHPLLLVLAPVFEANNARVEKKAPSWYELIGESVHDPKDRKLLQTVFLDFILQRLTHHTHQQLAAMFNFPSILDTVAGREIFADGEARGKAKLLQRQATRRFGKLPAKTEAAIFDLDDLQSEALADEILTLPSLAGLKQWLAQQKGK
jgi:predicted transposase YdaD